MNLRKARNYTIGLDLGTGSVGWAVVDENGEPYHIKGKPTLGARLFPGAETAADTRLKRGSRRRIERRKQRIQRLQEIFAAEINSVDPDFFIRMRMSSLVPQDKSKHVEFSADSVHALFNSSDFTEKEYYENFPTIWHARRYARCLGKSADITGAVGYSTPTHAPFV